MGLKSNPRASKSMQMSNPRGHHNYKKSEARIFKGFKLCFTSKPDGAYALRPLMDRKMNLEHRKVCKSRIHMGIIYTKNRKSAFSNVLKLCFTSKPDREYALRPLMDRKMNLEHWKVWKSRIRVGIIFTRNRKSAFSKVWKIVIHI